MTLWIIFSLYTSIKLWQYIEAEKSPCQSVNVGRTQKVFMIIVQIWQEQDLPSAMVQILCKLVPQGSQLCFDEGQSESIIPVLGSPVLIQTSGEVGRPAWNPSHEKTQMHRLLM